MSFNMPLPPALKTDPTKHPRNKTEKTDKEKVIYYMTLGGFLIAVTNNYLNDSK